MPDLLKRTLDKREEQIPNLIEARKNGKIAYFVLDKLIIKDKPLDSVVKRTDHNDSEHEVSFKSP